ncbi:hypothetical protein J3Q64DRAFT_1725205 [Phycomyces blakesleeanus]|uniref:W2 domain-containing protein n=2 Tax=Phycomyces blakesleeanus TaxID=4837 RepID=A0A167R220_PHYB8|nr:hypothetical protein PHYBLDRAFT_138218 [Phycomyces blakesleeanus NRRL 1555(-)]OAD80668.1 hypothetical protein PHYBLDRAFT_138218 [Phycomyces blakesleeanus NRRL 1555(-)]|eukprot:XP_018298708.1 hypothetical protein PHYBLDRAFT_138218 [Phycomyces blakesleeanus NRRL 1555(-)]
MSKSKQHSYHFMLREIRRLRSENACLTESVNILRDDLRVERDSRKIADECHQKFCNEAIDCQAKLESELVEKQEEIEALKEELDEVKSSSSNSSGMSYHDAAYFKKRSGFWGCHDFDSDTEYTSLPPIDPDKETISMEHEDDDYEEEYDDDDDDDDDDDTPISTSPFRSFGSDLVGSIFEQGDSEDEDQDQDQDQDHGENPSRSNDTQFEQLASSHLRQAFVSRLTSARANLELDDLMIKYDPSNTVLLRSLANTFISWLSETVEQADVDSAGTAKLIATRIQADFLQFWKSILERHIQDEAEQCQFLQETEKTILKANTKLLADNFHRLLVMLYKYDIVEGDAVTTWWHGQLGGPPETVAARMRNVTRKFVEWIDSSEDSNSDMSDQDTDTDPDICDGSDCDTLIGQHFDDPDSKNSNDDNDNSKNPPEILDNLLEQDKDYCVCQFDTTAPLPPSTPANSRTTLPACTCPSKYLQEDVSPSKPKKTVRIAM